VLFECLVVHIRDHGREGRSSVEPRHGGRLCGYPRPSE
jgi:hypothetical protein